MPGTDPNERECGRYTMAACLCEWVSDLSSECKHGLLCAAVSSEPPHLTGLAAVLKLAAEWAASLNVYSHTSRGLFSFAALAIVNNPQADTELELALRMLMEHGADLTLPASLTQEGEPSETLAHLAVEHNLGISVLRLFAGSFVPPHAELH